MQTGVDLNLNHVSNLPNLDNQISIYKKNNQFLNGKGVNAKMNVTFGSSFQDQYIKIISRKHIVN